MIIEFRDGIHFEPVLLRFFLEFENPHALVFRGSRNQVITPAHVWGPAHVMDNFAVIWERFPRHPFAALVIVLVNL